MCVSVRLPYGKRGTLAYGTSGIRAYGHSQGGWIWTLVVNMPRIHGNIFGERWVHSACSS